MTKIGCGFHYVCSYPPVAAGPVASRPTCGSVELARATGPDSDFRYPPIIANYPGSQMSSCALICHHFNLAYLVKWEASDGIRRSISVITAGTFSRALRVQMYNGFYV